MLRGFILALALAATYCAPAEESYIYWLVDWDDDLEAPTLDGKALSGPATLKVVSYADTVTWSDGVCLQLYTTTAPMVEIGESVRTPDIADDGPRFARIGDRSDDGLRYYVELYNDSGDILLGRSTEGISLAEARNMIWVDRDGDLTPSPPDEYWSVTAFASVPEPSSALLTALGLALLALRRRPHA